MYLSHFYLSIHPSVDIGCFYLFVIVNNVAVNMGVQVSYRLKSLLSILWDTYPEVALLTQHIFVPLKVIRCLHFGI